MENKDKVLEIYNALKQANPDWKDTEQVFRKNLTTDEEYAKELLQTFNESGSFGREVAWDEFSTKVGFQKKKPGTNVSGATLPASQTDAQKAFTNPAEFSYNPEESRKKLKKAPKEDESTGFNPLNPTTSKVLKPAIDKAKDKVSLQGFGIKPTLATDEGVRQMNTMARMNRPEEKVEYKKETTYTPPSKMGEAERSAILSNREFFEKRNPELLKKAERQDERQKWEELFDKQKQEALGKSYTRSLISSFGKGATQSVTDAFRGVSSAIKYGRFKAADILDTDIEQETVVTDFLDRVSNTADYLVGTVSTPNPAYEQNISSQIASGIGQVVPMVAMGGVGQIASGTGKVAQAGRIAKELMLRASGNSAKLAAALQGGKTVAKALVKEGAKQVATRQAALIGSSSFGRTYTDLIDQGYDEDTAFAKAATDAPIEVVSELISLKGIGKMLDVAMGKAGIDLSKKGMIEVAKMYGGSVATNAASEMAAQFGQNVTSQQFLDASTNLTDGIKEAGLVGGAVAAILGFPGMGATAISRYKKSKSPEDRKAAELLIEESERAVEAELSDVPLGPEPKPLTPLQKLFEQYADEQSEKAAKELKTDSFKNWLAVSGVLYNPQTNPEMVAAAEEYFDGRAPQGQLQTTKVAINEDGTHKFRTQIDENGRVTLIGMSEIDDANFNPIDPRDESNKLLHGNRETNEILEPVTNFDYTEDLLVANEVPPKLAAVAVTPFKNTYEANKAELESFGVVSENYKDSINRYLEWFLDNYTKASQAVANTKDDTEQNNEAAEVAKNVFEKNRSKKFNALKKLLTNATLLQESEAALREDEQIAIDEYLAEQSVEEEAVPIEDEVVIEEEEEEAPVQPSQDYQLEDSYLNATPEERKKIDAEKVLEFSAKGKPQKAKPQKSKAAQQVVIPSEEDIKETVEEDTTEEPEKEEVQIDSNIEANIDAPTRFSEVIEVNREDISTDPKTFQNRSTEASKETVQKIVKSGYDKDLAPIVVWKDPDTDKYVVLSGHSRWKASEILFKKGAKYLDKMNVKVYQGTKEEAIEYAKVDANRDRSQETITETIKLVRDLVKQGNKKKVLETFGPDLGKRYVSIARLNPKGSFISNYETLRNSIGRYETFAEWTGELRNKYPQLTNAHEEEVYKYFTTSKSPTKEELFRRVKRIVDRESFDPTKPLKLNTITSNPISLSIYQEQIDDLNNAKSVAQSEKTKLKGKIVELMDLISKSKSKEDIAKYKKQIASIEEDVAVQSKQIDSIDAQVDALYKKADNVDSKTISLFDLLVERTEPKTQEVKAVEATEEVPFDATGLIPTSDPAIYLKDTGNGFFVPVTDVSKLDEKAKKLYQEMKDAAKELADSFKNPSDTASSSFVGLSPKQVELITKIAKKAVSYLAVKGMATTYKVVGSVINELQQLGTTITPEIIDAATKIVDDELGVKTGKMSKVARPDTPQKTRESRLSKVYSRSIFTNPIMQGMREGKINPFYIPSTMAGASAKAAQELKQLGDYQSVLDYARKLNPFAEDSPLKSDAASSFFTQAIRLFDSLYYSKDPTLTAADKIALREAYYEIYDKYSSIGTQAGQFTNQYKEHHRSVPLQAAVNDPLAQTEADRKEQEIKIGVLEAELAKEAAAKKAAEMDIEALKKELDDKDKGFWNRAGFAEIGKEVKGLYNVFKSNAFFGKNTLSSIGGFEITDEGKAALKRVARAILKAGINVVSDIAEGMFDAVREAGVFKREQWPIYKPTLESIAQEVVDEQRTAKPAKMTAQQVKEGFEQLDTAEQDEIMSLLSKRISNDIKRLFRKPKDRAEKFDPVQDALNILYEVYKELRPEPAKGEYFKLTRLDVMRKMLEDVEKYSAEWQKARDFIIDKYLGKNTQKSQLIQNTLSKYFERTPLGIPFTEKMLTEETKQTIIDIAKANGYKSIQDYIRNRGAFENVGYTLREALVTGLNVEPSLADAIQDKADEIANDYLKEVAANMLVNEREKTERSNARQQARQELKEIAKDFSQDIIDRQKVTDILDRIQKSTKSISEIGNIAGQAKVDLDNAINEVITDNKQLMTKFARLFLDLYKYQIDFDDIETNPRLIPQMEEIVSAHFSTSVNFAHEAISKAVMDEVKAIVKQKAASIMNRQLPKELKKPNDKPKRLSKKSNTHAEKIANMIATRINYGMSIDEATKQVLAIIGGNEEIYESMTPEDAYRYSELVWKIKELESNVGYGAYDTRLFAEELAKLEGKYTNLTFEDKAVGAFVMNVLSEPMSRTADFISGLINLSFVATEMMFSPSQTPSEKMDDLVLAINTFIDESLPRAMATLKGDIGAEVRYDVKQVNKQLPYVKSQLSFPLRLLVATTQPVLRASAAGDQLIRPMVEKVEMQRILRRYLRDVKGMSKQDIKEYVDNLMKGEMLNADAGRFAASFILGNTEYGKSYEEYKDAVIQKSPQSLAQFDRLVKDYVLKNLPSKDTLEFSSESMFVGSERASKQVTFNEDPKGIVGFVFTNLVSKSLSTLLGRFADVFSNVTFARTSANIFNSMLDYMPVYGLIRAKTKSGSIFSSLDYFKKKQDFRTSDFDFSKDKDLTEAERLILENHFRDKAKMRAYIGLAVTAGIASAIIGDDDGEPRRKKMKSFDMIGNMNAYSEEERNALKMLGYTPNTLILGGRRINLSLIPMFALSMPMIGNLLDIIDVYRSSGRVISDMEMKDIVAAAGMWGVSTTLSAASATPFRSQFSTTSKFLNATRAKEPMEQYQSLVISGATNIFAPFIVPGVVGRTAQVLSQETSEWDRKDLYTNVMATMKLAPLLNALGEPMVEKVDAYGHVLKTDLFARSFPMASFKDFEDTPGVKIFRETGVMPSSSKIGNVMGKNDTKPTPLTRLQEQKLQIEAGKEVEKALNEIGKDGRPLYEKIIEDFKSYQAKYNENKLKDPTLATPEEALSQILSDAINQEKAVILAKQGKIKI